MIIPYPLQDKELIQSSMVLAASPEPIAEDVYTVSAFVPRGSYVSLGASNSLDTNVHLDNCLADGVQVFKRLSGGEAVFLPPNCTVFSAIQVSNHPYKASEFFAANLDAISLCLRQLGVQRVDLRGISDLAIGDKKILGSAIYRKTRFILFQAVLNVCESPQVIQKYLLHPIREPDYRKSRSHSDFVTSLHLAGYPFSPQEIAAKLRCLTLINALEQGRKEKFENNVLYAIL